MWLIRRLVAFLGLAVILVAGPGGAAPTLAGSVTARPVAVTPSYGNRTPVGGPELGNAAVVAHPSSGVPKPPKVEAKSYVVADLDSGKVLAAKDAHGRYRPASTLKTLTALALIPRLDADDKVRPQREDVDVEGSKVGITTKRSYRVDDLFRGLLLSSGNDAALALARAAGGKEHTVRLMNAAADELHANDTTAKTPNGLDRPGQRSSAYDLTLIARAALKLPDFRDYVSTVRAKFPAPHGKSFRIRNHNTLLTEYNGCFGVKTGYTTQAKATYVGAAKRHGDRIVVVVMHDKPEADLKDAKKLFDWGFAADGKVRPVGTLIEPGPRESHTADESPSGTTGKEKLTQPVTPGGATSSGSAPGNGRLLPILLAAVLTALVTAGSASLLVLRRRPRHTREARQEHRRPPRE